MGIEEAPELIRRAVQEAERCLQDWAPELTRTAQANHQKVLVAFQAERVSAYHFHGTTGYGLSDVGRDVLDQVTARILGTEAALVRSQFVSGTHALAAVLFGILRPGDHLLSGTGFPYDTLEEVIGMRGQGLGSLRDFGVAFDTVPLQSDGALDCAQIVRKIRPNTRLVMLQRSCGYTWRPSLTIARLQEGVRYLKERFPELNILVDNCYGELVETREPGDIGVDIMAGSLIKNLGGSLAPTGAYVAGRQDLVQLAAARLTAPGIGGAVGATLDHLRLYFQGLYMSPLTVAQALQGALFAAAFWQALGYEVHPQPREARTDLIQAIKLGSREQMIVFCQGIQQGSPIDAYVKPEPAPMPGYEDDVIMAGGTFIQGSTSEFSADGPLREPYIVYQQGGISYAYTRIGHILAAMNLYEKGLLLGG